MCIIVFFFHSSPLRNATADSTSQALPTVPGISVSTSKQPCSISVVNLSSTVFSSGMLSLPPSSSSALFFEVLSSCFFSVLDVSVATGSEAPEPEAAAGYKVKPTL